MQNGSPIKDDDIALSEPNSQIYIQSQVVGQMLA
eukprot:CAMPEP_0195148520 /NCGR_PEP_ID=MMETSP0448-20130528/175410_1 /TAXON_ID=66468 /ORGANISM="Heterocapsa triquestra, Strain CCMP 448" /LENGTH=33 /DNA_ID= /DNA_START= /DNA_END= /DNA_ORIENTATION=